MTQHYTGGKTIRTSAFSQIIVKDFQGLKKKAKYLKNIWTEKTTFDRKCIQEKLQLDQLIANSRD